MLKKLYLGNDMGLATKSTIPAWSCRLPFKELVCHENFVIH